MCLTTLTPHINQKHSFKFVEFYSIHRSNIRASIPLKRVKKEKIVCKSVMINRMSELVADVLK